MSPTIASSESNVVPWSKPSSAIRATAPAATKLSSNPHIAATSVHLTGTGALAGAALARSFGLRPLRPRPAPFEARLLMARESPRRRWSARDRPPPPRPMDAEGELPSRGRARREPRAPTDSPSGARRCSSPQSRFARARRGAHQLGSAPRHGQRPVRVADMPLRAMKCLARSRGGRSHNPRASALREPAPPILVSGRLGQHRGLDLRAFIPFVEAGHQDHRQARIQKWLGQPLQHRL